jgi:hypothetical protein
MGEKVRENRLRRQAKRLGFIIEKSRGKLWSIDNHLGYMVRDSYSGNIVTGERYNLSLDEVDKWLNDTEGMLKEG